MESFWLSFLENFYPIFFGGVAVLLLTAIFVVRADLRQTLRYAKRLELFRVRDELRFQVAIGTIQEDSKLFKHYDSLLNSLVRHTERISVYELIRSANELKESDTEARSEILALVKAAPEPVRALIGEVYCEVARIFFSQSKSLIVIVPAVVGARVIYDVGRFARFLPSEFVEEIRTTLQAKSLARVALPC